MQIKTFEDVQDVAFAAAEMIEQMITHNPQAILGLATGSTPIPTYQELIRRYQKGQIDFANVSTFNLDEYYGLEPSHAQSYHSFMKEHLFDDINLKEENIHIPCGTPEDVSAYCHMYEQKIEETGGIDLQLLGIGQNGHIGFNEPADQLNPHTHLVGLAPETIEANARFFEKEEDVPQYAITMGMNTIMKAKKIVLLATGKEKASIMERLVNTGITTKLPASLLRLHRDVTILIDREAGSLL